MKSLAVALTVVLVCLCGLPSEAEAKSKRKKRAKESSRKNYGRAFDDVPLNHWAYNSIQAARDAGILSCCFCPKNYRKQINRYQMAVVVARMIDRTMVLAANKKRILPEDVKNLMALRVEFAEELILLNMKPSIVDGTLADLMKRATVDQPRTVKHSPGLLAPRHEQSVMPSYPEKLRAASVVLVNSQDPERSSPKPVHQQSSGPRSPVSVAGILVLVLIVTGFWPWSITRSCHVVPVA